MSRTENICLASRLGLLEFRSPGHSRCRHRPPPVDLRRCSEESACREGIGEVQVEPPMRIALPLFHWQKRAPTTTPCIFQQRRTIGFPLLERPLVVPHCPRKRTAHQSHVFEVLELSAYIVCAKPGAKWLNGEIVKAIPHIASSQTWQTSLKHVTTS